MPTPPRSTRTGAALPGCSTNLSTSGVPPGMSATRFWQNCSRCGRQPWTRPARRWRRYSSKACCCARRWLTRPPCSAPHPNCAWMPCGTCNSAGRPRPSACPWSAGWSKSSGMLFASRLTTPLTARRRSGSAAKQPWANATVWCSMQRAASSLPTPALMPKPYGWPWLLWMPPCGAKHRLRLRFRFRFRFKLRKPRRRQCCRYCRLMSRRRPQPSPAQRLCCPNLRPNRWSQCVAMTGPA